VSAAISLHDPLHGTGIFNGLISITAIGATTYLGLQNQSVGMALQDARAELAHVNRITTLGELTAAITHEVNQPNGGEVTSAEAAFHWLAAQPPNLEEVQQALHAVVEDGKRASEIVARIRALMAKDVRSHREPLDINEVIIEVIALMRSEVQKNRILLQTLLSGDLPSIRGDRIQLQQVVLNLALNSIEAMSGKHKGPRELLIRTEKQNDSIVVAVVDRGIGLDPESLDRVFQAFYTTKAGGVGMGLSICRSIIESHGGKISAFPTAGGGATFRFSLPYIAN
jgi:signal transduction histidine kinase